MVLEGSPSIDIIRANLNIQLGAVSLRLFMCTWEETMRRVMSFMVGAMMGTLVGATIGLLMTPYSGDDLQAEIRARIERVQQEMKSAAQARREEMEAQLEALRAPMPPPSEPQ